MPEIEEREAARFSGYTWRQWQKLPRQERVDSIAYWRLRRQIEMHQADAQDRDATRRMKRHK